ncbi:unnamed protein product [Cuscuta campestris]|uniref:CCT domain-containing protein n=1 Tax=Cuscuta campestris TaxID=132261 RepID=A0A484LIT9_9ASTE|nr:unnamed protein product [Cuscuta campestris]
MSQAVGNDGQVDPHRSARARERTSKRHTNCVIRSLVPHFDTVRSLDEYHQFGSVSSVHSSRTFVLGKRRKNKRKSYDSKERYQRAHRKARIAKLRIWKRQKAAWERDDPEETFSVDSANSICGAGGDNPPVDSARLGEWEWVAC